MHFFLALTFVVLCAFTQLHLLAQAPCKCVAEEGLQAKLQPLYGSGYADSALTLITKIPTNDDVCKATAQKWRVIHFVTTKDVVAARRELTILWQLLQQNNVGRCSILRAHALYYLGQIFVQENSFDSASVYFSKAQSLAQQERDSVLLWRSFAGMGLSLSRVKQDERAIQYSKRALAITQALRDKRNTSSLLSNIAARYGAWYDASHNSMYLDSVEYYTKASLPLLQETRNITFLAQAYNLLAGLTYERKHYTRTLAYTDTTLQITGNKHLGQRTNAYQHRADAFLELRNYKQAFDMADSMYSYAQASNNLETITAALERLGTISEKLGKPAQALEYIRLWATLRDSAVRLEQLRTVVELEQSYNKVQNEKTINQLQQQQQITTLQNQVLIAVCVLAVLVLIIGIVLYRQRTLRNKHSLLQTELRLQRARMNPHFLFNLLASLQAIALNPSTSGRVSLYISKFANLMRQTLESTYTELIPLDQECSYLTNYLELQLLRFPDLFTYEITIDAAITTLQLSIPPMLIQPFVENAIEHGFQHDYGEKSVHIHFFLSSNTLQVHIKNSGWNAGTAPSNKEHISRARGIVKDRLSLLNTQHNTNATFETRIPAVSGEYLVIVTLPLFQGAEQHT